MLKNMVIKNKIIWGAAMLGLHGFAYWLCRYAFYGMHGMKQWPNLLALLGIVIIAIAVIFSKQITAVATVSGYLLGFILAMLFNTDGVDSRGGRTNNAWIIWGNIFVISILLGFTMDMISLKRIKRSKKT